jgi:subtilisin family serine protease
MLLKCKALAVFATFTVVFITGCSVLEQAKKSRPGSDVLHLKSRNIVLSNEGITPALLKQLSTGASPHIHAFVQLRQRPEIKTKQRLSAKGVTLLFHIQPTIWVASVKKGFASSDAELRSLVRWMGPIASTDKISPDLRTKRYQDWALRKGGRISLAVTFFSDIAVAEAERILGSAERVVPEPSFHTWYVAVPIREIAVLAVHDQVKWVEQGPQPFLPFISDLRERLGIEAEQGFVLNRGEPLYHGLSGSGIQVGVWDTGINRHKDFEGRFDDSIANIDGPGPNQGHGSRIAGIIGASGFRSAHCRPRQGADLWSPWQLRGIAPEVDFVVKKINPQFGGFDSLTLWEQIRHLGMDVSNHSYLQERNGNYSVSARSYDRYIRDGITDPNAQSDAVVEPARAMVWAAGNNGESPQHSGSGSFVRGYFSVESPAKNTITVGSIENLSDPRLARSSSLGPTWDGRIKPEIMAPGENTRDEIYKTDGIVRFSDPNPALGGGCYEKFGSGTSLSAPVVTGTIALMLQQYAEAYNIILDKAPPRPATLKAALVQTATDLIRTEPEARDWINPDTGAPVLYHRGPDYATGYGLINAGAAIRIVRKKHIVEDRIERPHTHRDFAFQVGEGLEHVQFTLAWDDEPFEAPMAAETVSKLVNDLDLTLIDPDGNEHLPWVLDPLIPDLVVDVNDPLIPDADGVDDIAAEEITPAHTGIDKRNNIEQVTVDQPTPGFWVARVRLSPNTVGLLEKPQPYSLAGDFGPHLYFSDHRRPDGEFSVYEMVSGEPVTYEHTSGYPAENFNDPHTPSDPVEPLSQITHFTFAPDGSLFATRINRKELYRLGSVASRIVYRHPELIRDIAFDHAGNLYVSEATGAHKDGKIFRVDLRRRTATVFYRVKLDEIGGFWAGDFTFDGAGDLILATGNIAHGRLFHVISPTSGIPPNEIYSIQDIPIGGIAFDGKNELYFADPTFNSGSIYRVDLSTGVRRLVYRFGNRTVKDIVLR